jgi:diguanylate cyclase
MNDTESLEETARYVRLLLPLMTKHVIPITPKNYTTWYDYVSGENKELQKAIDSIIEKKEPFSRETNEMLYQRFIVEQYENTLDEIRKKLQEILLFTLKELTEISGQTEIFESSALKCVDKLSEDMPVKEIRKVLDEVIAATKRMRRSGESTQQRLKETTENMQILQKEFEQAKTELLVDFLTGILNRKGFYETLEKSVSETTGHLSLLIVDLDHFKKFNDTHGHIVGDKILRIMAKNMQKSVRGSDFTARIGGEEFAVILPKTPLLGATTVAETLRASFSQLKLEKKAKSESLGTITVSIGVAQYRPGESLENLINRADKALYFAKNAGRNRVATESEVTNQDQ